MASSSGDIDSVLSEQSQRLSDDSSRDVHNFAGYAVSEAVRTTLGPNGLDKLLVDSDGDFVITNDGVKILQEMPVDHPGANMVIETALTQEREVGDGTTTTVVLTGELLSEGADLIKQGVHPSMIVAGYHDASRRVQSVLRDQATDLSLDDRETLENVVNTSMTGKGSQRVRAALTPLVVSAFQSVATERGLERDRIRIESISGASVDESELVSGYALGVDAVHTKMPDAVSEPDVALVEDTLQPKRVGLDDDITVSRAAVLDDLHESETEKQHRRVRQIVESGADVVFVSEGIGDAAKRRLTEEGVLAMRRIGFGAENTMGRIATLTGAEPVSVSELDQLDLGTAAEIVQEEQAGQQHYVIRSEDSAIRTLFIRGGSTRVVQEAERAVTDALDALENALQTGRVLPGGGASEVTAALELRDVARSFSSHRQLAVAGFADALEVIPRTLAANAGADSIDALAELRNRHVAGEHAVGVEGHTGELADMYTHGVVDPLGMKLQALRSAVEAACMLLRIDGTISAGEFTSTDPADEMEDSAKELARKKLQSE